MSERIRKKDLKKPDQLQTTTMKLMEYARENRSKIIAVSAAVVLVVFLTAGWYAYGAYNEKQAQDLFGKTMLFQKGNAATQEGMAISRLAVEKHKEIIEKYPGTDAANLSRYSLGILYYKLNEVDNAIKSYEEFLSKARANELVALAYSGLGYCYESKGDFSKAFKYFEDSAKDPNGAAFRGTAYLNAGRMAEQLKNSKGAVESYNKALESKNDSVSEMLLKRKISELE
jgi:tetratricopeptide (TPR) repeat protein